MRFDYRTSTGLGKQTLGGHKQNFVCTRTQEKGAVTPQETDPDFACECPGVSGRVVGRQWPAVGSGALDTPVLVQVLWKDIAIIAITPTILWPQEKL